MRARNILLAAAGAVAVGYVLNRVLRSQQEVPVVVDASPSRDSEIDAYVDDSFPASDPPSWSPGGNFH
jgi:hypothetical protein